MNTIGTFSAIPSALQSAELGIKRGLAGLDRDAATVAGATGKSEVDANGVSLSVSADNQTGALIDSQQQRLLAQASAKAMSIVERTLGSLIDTLA